jgi:hypothetical protein
MASLAGTERAPEAVANENERAGRSWLSATLLAGLAAGILDGTAASLFYGATPQRIFQSVASGVLGRRSFDGGWSTAALGMALHLTIAMGAAATYVAASRILPALRRQPLLYGPLYGIAVYFFMQLVVVPLSAAAQRGFSLEATIKGLAIHVAFVGLPIALSAHRWAPKSTAR